MAYLQRFLSRYDLTEPLKITNMKNLLFYLLAGMFMFQSCSAVEAVFKAGMWWAFFLVGIALLGVFLLLRRK